MRLSFVSLSAVSLCLCGAANANTVSYNFSSTGTFGAIAFTRFDTSLGALQSVNLSYSGASSFQAGLTGPPTVASGVGSYSIQNFFSIYAGPFTYDTTATGSGPLSYGSNYLVTLTSLASYNQTRSDAATLAFWSGAGPLSGSVNFDPPSVYNVTLLNVDKFSTVRSAASASGFVTYTYLPTSVPAVPEPSTWAFLSIGLAAVGVARRPLASARKSDRAGRAEPKT